MLYFYGFGVRQSYSQAAKLLRMSADKGDPDAQNKLAGMYDDGLGVARDARRAKALYLKSAAQGYSPAMVNLGRMLTVWQPLRANTSMQTNRGLNNEHDRMSDIMDPFGLAFEQA